ncbi:MAG: DUF1080 domain-containing protein [Planctomycetaceae bacterium]
MILRVLLIVVVIFGLSIGTASAQPRPSNPEAGPVYLDPSNVDEDFAYQGEYVGWQQSSRGYRGVRRSGLQVIALGDGQFSATGYRGGLPGDGWFGGDRQLFEGARTGDTVELTGEGYQLHVDGEMAKLTREDGSTAGEFHKVVRVSPTMGALPPPYATVLFQGDDLGEFENAAITPEGFLQAGTQTIRPLDSFRMHAEFLLPYKPKGRGQDRGNSGFYLQGRYEVQVLDTFGLEGVENHCGALYKTRRPDINMCFPPLSWQTYDIDFTPARFDSLGQKVSDMRISVWQNGVPIHANVAISNKTGAGSPEGPDPLPMKLQDHSNPVMYRNIWLIDRSASPLGSSNQVTAVTRP